MQKKLDKIFSILSEINPNPITELNSVNEFTLLIAIILSAQTTDKSVNKATEKLFLIAETPEKILDLGLEKLSQFISSVGLFNTKTKNILASCKILIDNFDSKVPSNKESLLSLPGVGRKTANVFLNCIYGEHVIAVDTHVARVANRLGICDTDNVVKIEETLTKEIPDKWKKNAHNWMVLHGRYICKAKKPNCFECPINEYCDYYQNIKK